MTQHYRPIEYPYRLYVWWALALLASLAILYIYFVNAIIMDVVHRERAFQAMNTLRSEVVSLESRSVVLSSAVTIERAKELGLIEIAGPNDFAYRGGAAQTSLTYNSY